MKIAGAVFNQLLHSLPPAPPERGGILGMCDGVICAFYLDDGTVVSDRNVYIPSIYLLNEKIEQWAAEGIAFAGMFHSHPQHQKELSADDRVYIYQIMDVMPGSISELYFPVILPGEQITAYGAKRMKTGVIIIPEDIIIIKESLL